MDRRRRLDGAVSLHIVLEGRHGGVGGRPHLVESGVRTAAHHILLHDLRQVNFWFIGDICRLEIISTL